MGPPGATPPGEEPRAEPVERDETPQDDERFLSERPPHHEEKS